MTNNSSLSPWPRLRVVVRQLAQQQHQNQQQQQQQLRQEQQVRHRNFYLTDPVGEHHLEAGAVEVKDNNKDEMCWIYSPSTRKIIAVSLGFFFLSTTLLHQVLTQNLTFEGRIEDNEFVLSTKDFFIGPCLVNTNKTCPDQEVAFFLYTRNNIDDSQQILVNDTGSNLADTYFQPSDPTKIIVHGYNSDMQLDSLVDIREEYLKKAQHNLIAVDWRRLAAGPCYPIAVHNVPHVGECLAQLIDRLKDYGAKDIHVIGFSLGAHVPAYSANHLKPYKLPRITGLDPAMPLFITVSKDEKLDSEDADFVDVFHTNAFIQGKIEPVGHIDFYMNGGINQPGCWEKRNPFGCNHHRAAMYFAESINSPIGFWGWPCPGFLAYLIGLCPPRFPAVIAGDPVDKNYRGFFIVRTKSKSPFAQGMFTVEPLFMLNL